MAELWGKSERWVNEMATVGYLPYVDFPGKEPRFERDQLLKVVASWRVAARRFPG